MHLNVKMVNKTLKYVNYGLNPLRKKRSPTTDISSLIFPKNNYEKIFNFWPKSWANPFGRILILWLF